MEIEKTGITPYEMVYGKKGRGPLEVLRDTWTDNIQKYPDLNKTNQEYLNMLKNDLKICNEVATEKAKIAQKKYVDHYNLRSKDKTFDVGEQVLVLQPDSTNKLKS